MKKIFYLLFALLLHSFTNAQDVIVTGGTTLTITGGTNMAITGDVGINSTGTLTNLGTLSVTGNWSNSGTVSVGNGPVTLNGASAQNISGATQFDVLQLNNSAGASLQSLADVRIMTALNLQNGNFDATNGSMTFLSTSVTQCAIINDFSGGFSGTLTGAVHAQRFYNSSLTFYQHFMGSPVNTPNFSQIGISGTPGYIIPTANCDETVAAPTSPYGTVFSYDETHNTGCGISQWLVLTSGSAQNGTGYSILKIGAGTLTLTGDANLNSSYSVTGLTNSNWSNTTLQGRTIASGWHLVTNPYLATLSISSGTTTENVAAGFDNQVQVWNSNGPFAGTYQPSSVLPPFQAFMIHKTNAGGTATYTLNGSDRVITPATFYRQANESELNITATNTANGLLDKTTVAFNSDATAHFDPAYDADKLAGALSRHTLYSVDDNRWMSVNVLHAVAETGAVAVGFEPGVSGAYVFNFDGLNSFDPTTYIILEDKKLSLMYNIRNGDYSFTSGANDDWNRFVLHFTPPASISTTEATCSSQGMINIQQPGTAVWNYVLTDNNNTAIANGTLNANSPLTVNAPAGVYTLTLTDNTGYTVAKNISVNGVEPVTASFQASAYTIEENQDIIFTSSSANANAYNWNFDDGNTATTATVTHSYSSQGVYTVVLTAANTTGCSSSTTRTVTVTSRSATGISNLADNGKVTIWSNENLVNIDFTTIKHVDAAIGIYNVLGQKIVEDKFTNSLIYRKEISNIEAAYLIVQVKIGEELITKKVFIINNK